MREKGTRPRSQRPKTSREPAALVPGALWGASCLLIALAVMCIAVGLLIRTTLWPFTAAFAMLALSSLALLALVLFTFPRDEAYDWNADLSAFPVAMRWPLQIGTWIGQAVVLIVDLVAVFGTVGGGTTLSGSSRWCFSLIAAIGATTTLATLQPALMIVSLLVVWGAVVAIALLRGTYGFLVGLVR